MQYAHLAQPTCLHNNLNVQRSFLSHNFNVVQAGRLQRTFRTLVHKGLQRPAIQTSLERALLHSKSTYICVMTDLSGTQTSRVL